MQAYKLELGINFGDDEGMNEWMNVNGHHYPFQLQNDG